MATVDQMSIACGIENAHERCQEKHYQGYAGELCCCPCHTQQLWQREDAAYHAKVATKLAEIDTRYTQKLAAVDVYYAAEAKRVERLYGLHEIDAERLAALDKELAESARLDHERWGGH